MLKHFNVIKFLLLINIVVFSPLSALSTATYSEFIERDDFNNFVANLDSIHNKEKQKRVVRYAVNLRNEYMLDSPDANCGILLKGLSLKNAGETYGDQKPEKLGNIRGSTRYFLRFNSVAPELDFFPEANAELAIPYIAAGNVLILVQKGEQKYFLVVSDKNKKGDSIWLPGGTKNTSEKDLRETTVREVYEESRDTHGTIGLDIDASKLKLIASVESMAKYFDFNNILDINHIFIMHIVLDDNETFSDNVLNKLFSDENRRENFGKNGKGHIYQYKFEGNSEADYIAAIPVMGYEFNCKKNVRPNSLVQTLDCESDEFIDHIDTKPIPKLIRVLVAHVSKNKALQHDPSHSANKLMHYAGKLELFSAGKKNSESLMLETLQNAPKPNEDSLAESISGLWHFLIIKHPLETIASLMAIVGSIKHLRGSNAH